MLLVVGDLMETIRMIHSMAKYYGSKDNMTTLMVKIANQMIKACRAWIRTIPPEYALVDDENANIKKHFIYDRYPKDILKKISDCIMLNNRYHSAYKEVLTKLLQTPQEKQFDFSEEAIFGNYDLFC